MSKRVGKPLTSFSLAAMFLQGLRRVARTGLKPGQVTRFVRQSQRLTLPAAYQLCK